jgi:uncharacterized membrane protein
MERILVVVFDSESKAQEASRILHSLEDEGEVRVYADAIVTRDSRDAITAISAHRPMPEGAMGATAVGSMIGMLAGPAGLAAGAIAGFVIGATTDFAHSRVDNDFVHDVANSLEPGKAAIVAEIEEDFTEAVDARLKPLGGFAFRRPLAEIVDTEYESRVRAFRAAVARLKAERARRRTERTTRVGAQ